MIRRKIYDGVHLNIISSEKFKTNFMSVNFIVPLQKETACLTALVPKILARGSKKYPDMAKISERLEYLYAAGISPIFVKRAQSIIVGFAADFIKDGFVDSGESLLESVCEVLFDIIFSPVTENGAFLKAYTESEKTDLINIINSRINNKAAYAKEKCIEKMFDGHPYGCSEFGTVEQVKSTDAKSVYDRYLEIINKAPVEIFFNGECDAEKLTEIIKKYVPEEKERNTDFPGRELICGPVESVKEYEETMPVAQGKLVMGLRMGGVNVNSENSPAFAVYNEILGGSPSSKLFMNVREAMSLCYYCRSMPDMFMSAMFISSGIESENLEKAKKAILEQLEQMKNADFSEEDIADAKRSLVNNYKELDDSAHSLCLWYLSRIISGNFSSPEETISKIIKVSKKEIVDVSKKVELDTVYFIKGTGKEGEDE